MFVCIFSFVFTNNQELNPAHLEHHLVVVTPNELSRRSIISISLFQLWCEKFLRNSLPTKRTWPRLVIERNPTAAVLEVRFMVYGCWTGGGLGRCLVSFAPRRLRLVSARHRRSGHAASCAEVCRDPLVTSFRPLAPPIMSAARQNSTRVQATGAEHLLVPNQ